MNNFRKVLTAMLFAVTAIGGTAVVTSQASAHEYHRYHDYRGWYGYPYNYDYDYDYDYDYYHYDWRDHDRHEFRRDHDRH